MMDINALRKFADTFGPAIEAIPAVIDAVSKKADLDREMAVLLKDIAAAKVEIQKSYDEADARIAVANQTLTELLEKQGQVVKETDAARKAADEKAKRTLTATNDKVVAAEAQLAGLQNKILSADADLQAKLQAMELEASNKQAELEAKTKDAEKRFAAAEKALESLKAKLG
jgi:hypothetical protein